MERYNILTHLDLLSEAYEEPTERVQGLIRNPKEVIRTVEFYTSNRYLSGNKDALGREKPFYNVCNYRVTTAKTATDLDVKDIRFEADSVKYSVQSMLINHELYKYLKEINFSETLNDMGLTRPKYGGVLVKNTDDQIDIVEWTNTEFDPKDVLGGTIVENHWLKPSELVDRAEAWNGYDSLADVLDAHAKENKGKPCGIMLKEVTGEFPLTMDPDNEDLEDAEVTYKRMCFYIAVIGNRKFLLYKEDLKKNEEKYKYLPWEKMGKGLGRGIVEEGFESQVWVNDSMISIKNAMDLSGKVLLSTNSQKVSGNALTGVDSGHIFQLEPNASITSLNLAATSMPDFYNVIELWNTQFDRVASTFDANTGEAPTAGTPYSQTALLNQVANSPFEFQREVWGIWLNEILNDWTLPVLKRRITKEHYLVTEFSDDELEVIDSAVAEFEARKTVSKAISEGRPPTYEEYMAAKGFIMDNPPQGKRRELRIPADFLDVEGNITANITGELKNKAAMLQSLDGIFNRITSTLNPQTGQFAALEDPKLAKLTAYIMEIAGLPFSFGELKGKATPTAPAMQPQSPTGDLSAVAPLPEQAAPITA